MVHLYWICNKLVYMHICNFWIFLEETLAGVNLILMMRKCSVYLWFYEILALCLIYSVFISLGFIRISLALMNNAPIIFPIIWTVCGVILNSLALSPDILSKKLQFKNERTYGLLNIITLICLIIALRIFAI